MTAMPALLFLLLFPATGTYALTCAVGQTTLSEAYEAADSIIVGLVTECKEAVSSDGYAEGGADCSFVSVEVLKNSVPARDYGGVASSSGCGLSLHVGSQYLLFLDSQNQPTGASAPLGGDHYQTRQANRYLQILRDFGNGRGSDLAEPWFHDESEGYCFIRQSINGHEISFSRRAASAPPQPVPEWTRETINGESVYRATVPLVGQPDGVTVGEAELVASNELPDRDGGALFLSVSLRDDSPATVRQATLSVRDRTWALNRMQMNLLLTADGTRHAVVEYWAAGEAAERILSAMLQPSGIVVSATLVPPNEDSGTRDVLEPREAYAGTAPPTGDFVGPSPPEWKSAAGADAGAADAYRVRELPEPRLRLESRSTRLPGVIERFRACYGGEPGR